MSSGAVCVHATRSLQRQSTPMGPFLKAPLPLEPRGRARFPIARLHSLSSPDSQAGLELEDMLQSVSSLTPGNPRCVGDPLGGWAAFRRPAGPAFRSSLPSLETPWLGTRDIAAALRPLTRLPSGLFLWVRPPSPGASASAALLRARGYVSALPGRAGCRGQSPAAGRPGGVRSRPEWAAVAHSPTHTLSLLLGAAVAPPWGSGVKRPLQGGAESTLRF